MEQVKGWKIYVLECSSPTVKTKWTLREKQTDASRAMPGWKVEGVSHHHDSQQKQKQGLWQIWFLKIKNNVINNSSGFRQKYFIWLSLVHSWRLQWCTLFTADILTSHSRKSTGGGSDINVGCCSVRWARSPALVLCMLTHRPGLQSHRTLPKVQPPFSLLFLLTDCLFV